MPAQHISIEVTATSTTAQMPLGFEWEQSESQLATTLQGNGPRVWVYVQNGEASTAFAAGNPIIRKTDATTRVGIIATAAATASHRVIGIAQHAIAAGSYGFILKQGRGLILPAAAGIVKSNAITVSDTTAGTLMASVLGTNESIGYADATGVAATTVNAWIDCPG